MIRGRVSGPTGSTRVWNIVAEPFPSARRLMASDNVPHHVWQTSELGNQLTSSSGGETNLGMSFTLANIQGISSWLAVFDQYKIAGIEVWITPSSSSLAPSDNFRWLSVVDYDDSTSPSFNGLLQYSNVTDCGRNEGVYRNFVPHINSGVGAGGSTVLSGDVTSPWINSAQSGVNHFGIKFSMSATTTTVVLAVRARFHIVFKNNF